MSTAGFVDAFDVNFLGVVNTVHASMEYLGEGGSIIAIGSVAGLVPQTGFNGQQALQGPGGDGYGLAKKLIQAYTSSLALTLGPSSIRVNAIHPTNVNTDMLQSMPMYRTFRPDLENPTAEDAAVTFPFMQRCRLRGSNPRTSRMQSCTCPRTSRDSSPASNCAWTLVPG